MRTVYTHCVFIGTDRLDAHSRRAAAQVPLTGTLTSHVTMVDFYFYFFQWETKDAFPG